MGIASAFALRATADKSLYPSYGLITEEGVAALNQKYRKQPHAKNTVAWMEPKGRRKAPPNGRNPGVLTVAEPATRIIR
jgi:hypothetical protein